MLWLALALAQDIHPMLGPEIQWRPSTSDAARAEYDALGVDLYEAGVVPRERWGPLGIGPDDWWVLPADGPAVPATVTDVVLATPHECGGFMGVAVRMDTEGIAAVQGPAPTSWHRPVPPATDAARARVTAWLDREGLDPEACCSTHVSLAFHGDVALARVTTLGPESEDAFGYAHAERDLRIDAEGVQEIARRTYHQFAPPLRIQGLRDLDGDGRIDVVEGSCIRRLRSLDGTFVRQSLSSMCCGC